MAELKPCYFCKKLPRFISNTEVMHKCECGVTAIMPAFEWNSTWAIRQNEIETNTQP